jgi:hypothetical protein
MRKLPIAFVTCLLSFCISTSYAITVTVQSTSKNITGLGFKANGKKHGGLGTKYHASGMPKGTYAFGVRMKGKDVPCLTKDGKRTTEVTKNTNATLVVKGGSCSLKS